MPNLRTETFGSGDQSWLGSSHGLRNARSGTIDISTFTPATHHPDGYLRSGTPVDAANEAAIKPWTGAEGEELGFVLFDTKVHGATDISAAIFRHGTINVGNLPVAFTVPDTGAAGFVFVNTGGN